MINIPIAAANTAAANMRVVPIDIAFTGCSSILKLIVYLCILYSYNLIFLFHIIINYFLLFKVLFYSFLVVIIPQNYTYVNKYEVSLCKFI